MGGRGVTCECEAGLEDLSLTLVFFFVDGATVGASFLLVYFCGAKDVEREISTWIIMGNDESRSSDICLPWASLRGALLSPSSPLLPFFALPDTLCLEAICA